MTGKLGPNCSAATLFSAVLAVACVHPYAMPKPNEPHAVLKVRRVYEKTPGATLSETLLVDGELAFGASEPSQVAQAPRSDALLIHPRPAKFEIAGQFAHQEMQNVQESYTEQEPYDTTEYYDCGFGGQSRSCSRTVTNYRTVTKSRWVSKTVDVPDGGCEQTFWIAPQMGHVYLVDFTYRDSGLCSALCVEQSSFQSDGTFASSPCPLPAPAQSQAAKEAPARRGPD